MEVTCPCVQPGNDGVSPSLSLTQVPRCPPSFLSEIAIFFPSSSTLSLSDSAIQYIWLLGTRWITVSSVVLCDAYRSYQSFPAYPKGDSALGRRLPEPRSALRQGFALQ